MTRRAGKAGSTGQRVPNPFESTEDTSTGDDAAIAGPESVFPVRRFVIEDSSAKVRAYGHVLTSYGWVKEGSADG